MTLPEMVLQFFLHRFQLFAFKLGDQLTTQLLARAHQRRKHQLHHRSLTERVRYHLGPSPLLAK
jgi:hypothetical protein